MTLKTLLTFLIISLFTIPVSAFAHGTEAEHQQEVVTNMFLTYGIVISAVLLVVGIVVLLTVKSRLKTVNVKKQEGRTKRDKLNSWLKVSQWVSLLSLISFIILGAFALLNEKEDEVKFMDIHGLGFTNEGSEIYVPAHDGLKVFQDGKWRISEGERNDYMGFSMVDNGFYSSGHPGKGSSLKNPFGVIKSTDFGKNLETLDFYGEIDFHGMAVGYKSHTIYVINPQANSRMDDTGLYYSTDDTKTWNKGKMDGLDGQLSSIAVHPTEEEIIALGTNEGIFVSKDFGQSFKKVSDSPTTAISFSIKGELFAGSISNEITLSKIDIETKEQTMISIPPLSGENAIGYIAVNPQNEKQIIFTTFEKDIYITEDNGGTWSQLAKKGVGIALKSDAEEE
ncbi:F510_1955 family glycosylhydrolase [Bacillus sp. AFS040349]|uniref:F510_1955 family glycosylhydrolase n=1 Tax=Bacillus sp. AFS040349 TaxID=2033502 RepID=UPI000BFCB6F7|nr:hypothetical protein [Bacillus sp. AFS040349]PGT79583.1 hypothetical protein COD11_22355 [Bacillus sp. AFS040349]